MAEDKGKASQGDGPGNEEEDERDEQDDADDTSAEESPPAAAPPLKAASKARPAPPPAELDEPEAVEKVRVRTVVSPAPAASLGKSVSALEHQRRCPDRRRCTQTADARGACPASAERRRPRFAVMRAPEAPSGWPRAMAPPLTLVFSSARPSSFSHREELRRERLVHVEQIHVAEGESPARSSALRIAGAGPIPISVRLDAGDAPLHELGEGLQPLRLGPLCVGDHQHGRAVADPAGVAGGDDAVLLEDGGSLARVSSVVCGRGCSSSRSTCQRLLALRFTSMARSRRRRRPTRGRGPALLRRSA
jgi:hypothetical protein